MFWLPTQNSEEPNFSAMVALACILARVRS
jgi:hypothetical protein